MHTARSLTVSQSMLCSGEGAWFRGGRVSAWSGGCLPGPGGCLSGPEGGVGIPACTEADPRLWTEFLTHASDNITLPQTSFAGGKKRHVKTYFIVKTSIFYFLFLISMQYLFNAIVKLNSSIHIAFYNSSPTPNDSMCTHVIVSFLFKVSGVSCALMVILCNELSLHKNHWARPNTGTDLGLLIRGTPTT